MIKLIFLIVFFINFLSFASYTNFSLVEEKVLKSGGNTIKKFNIIKARLINNPNNATAHYDFALFCYNHGWTKNAEEYNYENVVFLDDKESVEKYIKEFDKLWKK